MGLTGGDRGAPVDPDGEMFPLLVDPAHAGRGVGRMLLTAAHKALRAAGAPNHTSSSMTKLNGALAVYAAAGNRPDGTVRELDSPAPGCGNHD